MASLQEERRGDFVKSFQKPVTISDGY